MFKLKNLVAFILLHIFFTTATFSQGRIDIRWQQCYGGGGGDFGKSAIQTPDSGFIFVGKSYSFGGAMALCTVAGQSRIMMVKTDANGNLLWYNCIGNEEVFDVGEVVQTSDGGFVVIGTTAPGKDIYIVKTDSAGGFIWENMIGGSIDDEGNSIAQLSDGNYILTGGARYVPGNHGLDDYWLVKLDTVGNVIWQKCFGGTGVDIATAVLPTSDNGFIITGSTESGGGDVTGFHGNKDIWVVKTDSAGNLLWQNSLGGSEDDEGYDIVLTPDGGYITAGASNSYDGDITGSHGGFDFWIAKLDNSGTLLWQKCVGSPHSDRGYSISNSIDGSFVLAGYTNNSGSLNSVPNAHANEDFLAAKIDSTGNQEWIFCFGGSQADIAYSIVWTFNNEYVIFGDSQSGDGDLTRTQPFNRDFWAVRFSDQVNSIKGISFVDTNMDGIKDSSETGIPFHKIVESATGHFDFTSSDGNYDIAAFDSGSFSVAPDPLNYFNSIPASHPAVFTSIDQVDSLNDFAAQATGPFNDLCVNITPMGNFRAGFQCNYMINYNNVGSTAISPTIIFVRDQDVTMTSSTPAANIQGMDSLVWTPGVLQPFESGSIVVTVLVNVSTPIGTLINSYAVIEPIAGDVNPGCNTDYWEILTTGSYDPNDVIVSRKTLFNFEFPNPPYLEYLVRFQNTGNDTAFNVSIQNHINSQLKLNTLEIVASSHPMQFDYTKISRDLNFTFENILLPDKFTNEPSSHGFVRYRIQPVDTLVVGNQIKNQAYIYFDFNSPVMTNTAITTVILPTGLSDAPGSDSFLQLYPNPANKTITLQCNINATELSIVVTDISGRQVMKNKMTGIHKNAAVQLDIESLSNGIYLLEVTADENVMRKKFVKQ